MKWRGEMRVHGRGARGYLVPGSRRGRRSWALTMMTLFALVAPSNDRCREESYHTARREERGVRVGIPSLQVMDDEVACTVGQNQPGRDLASWRTSVLLLFLLLRPLKEIWIPSLPLSDKHLLTQTWKSKKNDHRMQVALSFTIQ